MTAPFNPTREALADTMSYMARKRRPLSRVYRDPASLKKIIAEKKAKHQNCSVEEHELTLATTQQIRREMKAEKVR